ncbi:unnamed protein product, partial [Urochloa humidicola]
TVTFDAVYKLIVEPGKQQEQESPEDPAQGSEGPKAMKILTPSA